MYINSLFEFSLLIEARSSISLLLMYIHRSPEFTRFRLSRQKGQDSDLACLNQQKDKKRISKVEETVNKSYLQPHLYRQYNSFCNGIATTIAAAPPHFSTITKFEA